MKFRFVDSAKAGQLSIRRLCVAVGVSNSGYFAWRRRKNAGPGKREVEGRKLRQRVVMLHERSRKTYGRPRLLHELRAEGWKVGGNRIRRIMLQEGICGRKRKRWKAPKSEALSRPSENLLERNFKADAPNRVWCGDVTEFDIGGRKLYLATVIDLYSRRAVGLAFGLDQTTSLVTRALMDALRRREPAPGVVFHSDRGGAYRSTLYRAVCSARGVVQSMSRAYNCLDNAVAESFFATLEHELHSRSDWLTPVQAEQEIRDYILNFYNPIRRHSHNQNLAPEQFEALVA